MSVKNKVWYFAKYVSSLRFSVALLLILASVSVTGTIIEQNQSLDYYRFNYPDVSSAFFCITWKQIIALGLNHVYSTFWFFAILILFFFSLLFCTLSTQLPMLKNARRWNFLHSQTALKAKSCYSQSKYSSILNFAFVLSLKEYYIFHRGKAVYAYKGLVSRIAPIFVHFSIVFTLVGSVVGFTNGFIAQEMVPIGEVFHVQNFVKSGYFSCASSDLIGRVDDFFLVFNHDKSVQQFFSKVSLMDDQGHIFLEKSISVNTPLKFRDSTFYQIDWKITALRLKMGSNKLLAKSLKQNNLGAITDSTFWYCNLALDEKHSVFVVISNLNDELLVYDSQGSLISVAHYGIWNVIYGIPIVFKSVISSTGLQVKTDPGINLAYFGFFVLIVSISVSYFSYSQIWASKNISRFYFSGGTNRAFLKFEDEIAEIYKKYMHLFWNI